MKTKTITIYTINELSENAQENAHNNWLRDDHYPWETENRQSLEAFADVFPIKVKSWEYGGYSCPSINWTFTGDDTLSEMKGIRLWKYLKNNYTERKFKYGNNLLGGDYPFTGYCMDEDLIDPIRSFMNKPDKTASFNDLMGDCLNSWLSACNSDAEYNHSFPAFKEISEANEWEYDETGEIV